MRAALDGSVTLRERIERWPRFVGRASRTRLASTRQNSLSVLAASNLIMIEDLGARTYREHYLMPLGGGQEPLAELQRAAVVEVAARGKGDPIVITGALDEPTRVLHPDRIGRRHFVMGCAAAALVAPLAAQAQPAKVPTIGVLVLGNPDPGPFRAAFQEGLQKVGYAEGQNIRLEFRSAAGKASALGDLAAELVRLKVDIIVVWQTPAAQAAKQATSDIPIVMAQVGDPVGTGLVASLARPGGNVTGNTGIGAELVGKLLELVRETLPTARRVAVLANATDPFTRPFLSQIEQVARTLKIGIERVMASPAEPFDAYFEAIRRKQADAVIVQPTLLRPDVADLALKHRLPSFSPNRQLPLSGGLMSYSAIASDLWREAAVYVDKILKGSRPADLPVARPTRFELIINLKTAKALGLTVPPPLLARADKVIE